MKNRKLKLVVKNMHGIGNTEIATVKIANFAEETNIADYTDLVCPKCFEKPVWKGGYVCQKDGLTFPHWSRLMRVLRGTKNALTKPRLLEDKELAEAYLYWMPQEEFAKNYVDATRKDNGEKGIVIEAKKDEDKARFAKLLFQILVGVVELGYVVVAKWKDTEEEVIALLMINPSGRILLREIIPANLVQTRETLVLDRNAITKEDIDVAKAFVKTVIPRATKETFEAQDYRIAWLTANEMGAPVANVPNKPDAKVVDLKAIMAEIAQTAKKRK